MKSTFQLSSLTFFMPALFAHPLFLAGGLHPAIPKAFNLILFITVMYLLVRKPARAFFAERLAEVRTLLDRAAKERSEAQAKMNELNARLNKLDAEVAEIRAQAAQEAKAERLRLASEAQADADKLRITAQREIEGAKQSALVQLREFTADKAVELAEQMIRRELTPEDDDKLLRRVSEELGKAS